MRTALVLTEVVPETATLHNCSKEMEQWPVIVSSASTITGLLLISNICIIPLALTVAGGLLFVPFMIRDEFLAIGALIVFA
jgi:hypothetical protein